MKLLRKKIRCARCELEFRGWNALKKHSKTHLNTLKELKQLQQGKVPEENKFGADFKGKNKVIVS